MLEKEMQINNDNMQDNTKENSFWQKIMKLKPIYQIILIVFILILFIVIVYLIMKFKGKVSDKKKEKILKVNEYIQNRLNERYELREKINKFYTTKVLTSDGHNQRRELKTEIKNDDSDYLVGPNYFSDNDYDNRRSKLMEQFLKEE